MPVQAVNCLELTEEDIKGLLSQLLLEFPVREIAVELPRWIISLEKGQYNPSLLLAYRIAKVFCTSVEELYCLEENLELDEKQYRELQTDVGKGEQ